MILDLVVVRTLLTTLGRPIKLFAFMALPAMLLSLTFFGLGLSHLATTNTNSIYFGAGVLWMLLALFSITVGILAELFYAHIDYRESQLASLTKVYHG